MLLEAIANFIPNSIQAQHYQNVHMTLSKNEGLTLNFKSTYSKNLNRAGFYSLGHSTLLHSLVEESGPRLLQSSPPLEGGGLVHVLVLVFTPPPQVFEQSL